MQGSMLVIGDLEGKRPSLPFRRSLQAPGQRQMNSKWRCSCEKLRVRWELRQGHSEWSCEVRRSFAEDIVSQLSPERSREGQPVKTGQRFAFCSMRPAERWGRSDYMAGPVSFILWPDTAYKMENWRRWIWREKSYRISHWILHSFAIIYSQRPGCIELLIGCHLNDNGHRIITLDGV